MCSFRRSPVPTPRKNRPGIKAAAVAAAWAMIAGWIRIVGHVTPVPTRDPLRRVRRSPPGRPRRTGSGPGGRSTGGSGRRSGRTRTRAASAMTACSTRARGSCSSLDRAYPMSVMPKTRRPCPLAAGEARASPAVAPAWHVGPDGRGPGPRTAMPLRGVSRQSQHGPHDPGLDPPFATHRTGGPDGRHHAADRRARQDAQAADGAGGDDRAGRQDPPELFATIKGELTLHEVIEEEIFYPGAQGAPEGDGHRPRGLPGAPRRRPADGRARGASTSTTSRGAPRRRS